MVTFSRQRQRRHVLTITAGERWTANAIARGILHTKRRSEFTLRVLTRDDNDEHVRELERLGAEVVEIDYNKPKSLEDALCDTNWLVVFHEEGKNIHRQAEEMAKAARRSKVENMIFMSIDGADRRETNTQREYYELEKIFREHNDSLVIFRWALAQQIFMLWSEASQDDSAWLWPIDKRDRFVPISISDVVECIRHLVCDQDGLRDELDCRHERQTYRLTGPESLDGSDIVEIVNDVIREGEIELRRVDRREFEEYLRNLDEDEDECDRTSGDENRRRRRGRRGDRDVYPAPFLPLSDCDIECVMDYFEYVKKGHASRVSPDVRKLTHNEPQPIDIFFKDNSDDFQPDTRRRPGRPGRPRRPRRGGRRDRDELDDCEDCYHRHSYNEPHRFIRSRI